MGSMSIWHWLIVLVVVVLVFGTKKLRNLGGDVGGAVKNFKDAMAEGKAGVDAPEINTVEGNRTENLIEADVTTVKTVPKKRKPAKPKTASSATKSTVAKKPSVK